MTCLIGETLLRNVVTPHQGTTQNLRIQNFICQSVSYLSRYNGILPSFELVHSTYCMFTLKGVPPMWNGARRRKKICMRKFVCICKHKELILYMIFRVIRVNGWYSMFIWTYQKKNISALFSNIFLSVRSWHQYFPVWNHCF